MAIREYSSIAIAPPVMIGASHKTLSIEGRERLAAIGCNSESVKTLASASALDNLAVLSTCNRFECISFAPDGGESLSEQIVRRTRGAVSQSDINTHVGDLAIERLLNVTASLDSLVLGESQILGQVKNAYRTAIEANTATRPLHALFQYAFKVAKKVRSQTAVSERGVSVSFVAVKLAEQIFDGLKGRKVMLIGSGEMAELALMHLKSYGCDDILIANRTVERAKKLAQRLGGNVIGLDQTAQYLPSVDVVISSVSSDQPLVRHSDINNLSGKDILLIDCGLPRNFHPDIANFDGVYLYNIDDLQSVADQNMELRQEAARDAELIVKLGAHRFDSWLKRMEREPYLLHYRKYLELLCTKEFALSTQQTKRFIERASLGFEQVMTAYAKEEPDAILGDPGELFLKVGNDYD